MCDPVTLTIAATAVAVSGKVMQGIGEAQQYRAQAAVDANNARLANEQAKDSIENTNLESQRHSRETAQLKGRQLAAMASSGVSLDFGSAIDVQKDTAMINAEDKSQIYKGGNERTKGFEMNAFNYKSSAAANKAKAKGAILNAGFGALSSALGGASQIAGMSNPAAGASGGGGGDFGSPQLGTNRVVVGRGAM